MVCIGEAIRHFPYSKHVLYRDEMNGLYYGISHTIYKLFKKRVFTKRFKKKDMSCRQLLSFKNIRCDLF